MSPVAMRHEERLSRLRKALEAEGLPALLLTHLPNIRYLTGFTGSEARLVVTPRDVMLLVDGRYRESAVHGCPGCTVMVTEGDPAPATRDALALAGVRRVGFESGALSYWDHGRLEVLVGRRARLLPAGGEVETLRRVKDVQEIEALMEAAALTATALTEALADPLVGMPTCEVAARFEARCWRSAGDRASFPPLVSSGPESARIHAHASRSAIRADAPLLVDVGAMVHGYRADMARTICPGVPDATFPKVERAVQEAARRAIAAIRPGVCAGDVDALARDALAEHGYELAHGLGHGVGLEAHEDPWIVPGEATELVPGMVLALEPAIYLEGWGGYRHEDTILVTDVGCQVLTQSASRAKGSGVLS